MIPIINDVVRFLFPACCFGCGKRLDYTEEFICDKCFGSMHRTCYHYQKHSRLELFLATMEMYPSPVKAAAAFFYGETVKKMALYFKKPKGAKMAEYVGYMYVCEILSTHPDYFDDIDAVVPVPTRQRKRLFRKYNHSEAFARGIAKALDKPLLNDVVVKAQKTPPQKSLPRKMRAKDLGSVYRLIHADGIVGKHLLLVDDVVTSGATIRTVMRQLVSVDGVRVSVIALAHATAKSIAFKTEEYPVFNEFPSCE